MQKTNNQKKEFELSFAIYLYFKKELDDFVNDGISEAQDLAEKISSNNVNIDGQDRISLRYKALLNLRRLPPVDRNDILLEALMMPNQLPIDYLTGEIRDNFIKLILSKGGTEQEAKDCYYQAMVTIYKKALDGSLDITKTIEDYVFMVARNNWFAYIKKKNNYKKDKSSSIENPELDGNQINPFLSNRINHILDNDDDDNDEYDIDINIRVDSIKKDIDYIKEKIFGKDELLPENDILPINDSAFIDDTPDIDPNVDEKFKKLYKILEQILDKSYQKCKILLREYYFYNKSWDEIANKYNYSNGGDVCSLASRCRSTLKKKLINMGISLNS